MSTPTQLHPIRPANLKAGAGLLGENYQLDGQTFHLWVTTRRDGWRVIGYSVDAATVPGDGFDLFQIASDSFVQGCQKHADRVFHAQADGDRTDALAMTQRQVQDYADYCAEFGVGAI
ncbi:hypothetical protein [Herbaspirillum frisingense]|uniref:hypothetical protein n=1 Tax=Herbaspirillum frisingense TaxID=92645 RepID=UPI0039B1041D